MARPPRFKSKRTLAPQSAPGIYVSTYTPELGAAICERLVMGESLAAICARRDMPSIGTVYNWLRRYPDFLQHYRWAKAAAPDAMLEVACAGLPWIGERKSWPMLRRVVRQTDRASARLSLKRYAPAEGPAVLTVGLERADGSVEVIYGGAGPGRGGPGGGGAV